MEYEQEYVCDIYNQISAHFHKTRGYKWSWIEEFINNLSNGSCILDIGCGNGRNMLNNNHTFIGIDNSIEFLKICISQGLSVLLSDMTSIPINTCSQDAIVCIASFHHLSNRDRRISALKEMKRIIKPGGKILISVWSKNQPDKTRRKFDRYGDIIVTWNNNRGKIYNRYYYIFKIDEITKLFNEVGLNIDSHDWDCGNEVFILS